MFAFAVWDARRERLLLARDRIGKKPLYVARTPRGWLVFASELRALYAAGVARELDADALPAYLAHGYVPGRRTLVAGVEKLPPGTYRVVERGRVDAPVPYFGVGDLSPERPRSFADAVAGVRAGVERAVERRLEADVGLGAFLSGGLDSTVIVAVAQRLLGRRLDTFAMGFAGGGGYDETAWARLVAERLGTRHHETVLSPDIEAVFPLMLAHHGEPFGDSSALPCYMLSRFAHEHVSVVLTGDGGDEAFCGYERMRAALVGRFFPSPLARLGAAVCGLVPDGHAYASRLSYARRFFAAATRPSEDGYRLMSGVFDDAWLARLLGAVPPPSAVGLTAFAEGSELLLLPRILWGNLRTYLAEDLLPKIDRATMAVGLEARSPFLDTALLAYTIPLPARWHLRRGRLKALLRAAFADEIPRRCSAAGSTASAFRSESGYAVRSARGWKTSCVRVHARAPTWTAPPSARSSTSTSAAGAIMAGVCSRCSRFERWLATAS